MKRDNSMGKSRFKSVIGMIFAMNQSNRRAKKSRTPGDAAALRSSQHCALQMMNGSEIKKEWAAR